MTEQPKDIVLSNNDMHPAEEIAHLKNLLGKANALARIRAERIKELEAQASAEPVAWVLEWTFNGEERGSRLYDDETHCKFDAGQDGGVCRPLVYGDTHPPEARVPLTDGELRNISKQQDPVVPLHHNVLAFARAIEAAHGIGGGK